MATEDMTDFTEIAEKLESTLQLAQPPIAVGLTDEIPEGVAEFEGHAAAGCQFWEKAAHGPIATSTPDHELCAIGVHTHQMADPSETCKSELVEVLGVLGELDYVRDSDVPRIPVMSRVVKHAVYAPLKQLPFAPDAVLLFANAAAGLIIAEAVEQVDEGPPPALGRPACAAIPQTINSGRATLSLGCCGARAYIDVMQDDIAMWVIPGDKIATFTEQLASLAKANQILSRFHTLRREDVDSGNLPSVEKSLSRLQ